MTWVWERGLPASWRVIFGDYGHGESEFFTLGIYGDSGLSVRQACCRGVPLHRNELPCSSNKGVCYTQCYEGPSLPRPDDSATRSSFVRQAPNWVHRVRSHRQHATAHHPGSNPSQTILWRSPRFVRYRTRAPLKLPKI